MVRTRPVQPPVLTTQDFGHYPGMYFDACLCLLNADMMKKRVASRLRLWVSLTRLAILNLLFQRFRRPCKTASILGFLVRLGDIRIAYKIYIDLFVHGDYHFYISQQKPVIYDCGAHIGLSILFFKLLYPHCVVTAFEPNPVNFKLLEWNLRQWGFAGVNIHNLALSDHAATVDFVVGPVDGDWGGYIRRAGQGAAVGVQAEQLSTFLSGPVDLLKLDVEGEEARILAELDEAGKMASVRRIVLEFHLAPHLLYAGNSLAQIIGILESANFRFAVTSSEDAMQSAWTQAHEAGENCYQLLIYASQYGGNSRTP